MFTKKLGQKTLAVLLSLIVGSSILTASCEAKPKDHGKPPAKHQHLPHKKHKECSDIIMDVMRCDRHDFDKARHAGMTLEDYIIAQYIAAEIGGDFTDIFRMQKNGKPYKKICKAHGINWGSVRRHVNNSYDKMSSDAIGAGLVMWGLHELLH